jgi:hypothetical protein
VRDRQRRRQRRRGIDQKSAVACENLSPIDKKKSSAHDA